MGTIFVGIIKTIRPRQWLKNLTIFAGLVFAGRLFVLEDFLIVSYAVFVFSLLTSSIYIINDIKDAPLDRLHPFKKRRAIASGDLPVVVAGLIAVVLLILALFLAYHLSARFFLASFAYMLLQFLYMAVLKNVIILDVISIASGFLLRIYAGLWLINAHLNIWFLLCIVSFALFVAIGKRRAEATLLMGYAQSQKLGSVRSLS